MKFALSAEILLTGCLLLPLFCGCNQQERQKQPQIITLPVKSEDGGTRNVVLTPEAIPGTPRSENNETTGGYAPSHVEAQLKIDVKEGTREVKVIRDNADPYVITKPYKLKHADPYAVRSYLEAAVGAKSVNDSPAQVTAVKFADGSGVILVSAEEYRFHDSEEGRGIDRIVAALDREGLTFLPEADAHIYFPRITRAVTLQEMLLRVGSSELDPEFAVAPGTLMVDPELNALIAKASKWNWAEMRAMLKQYDRPVPEMKITYRVLEIYAENDDRIGVDFQSWKNNDGVDLFAAGTVTRRNWGTFFTSGVQDTGNNHTSWWNFNPKWNTRYLDFMTSIGKAKCLAQGSIVVQNRKTSQIEVNTGFFYDRTYYTEGATSIAEACTEFTYTEPNPNTIQREGISKIMPLNKLQEAYASQKNADGSSWIAGRDYYLAKAGYTMRLMGTQVTTAKYYDAIAKLSQKGDAATSNFSKFLNGYVKADGKVVDGAYSITDYDTVDSAPGIIHGWLQYPMVQNGFKFKLQVTPVVTGKAAKLRFDLGSISLLGWNSDGSARSSKSATSTTVQVAYGTQDFVIGGLRKSESVRGTAGLPYMKDLPVVGRLFSTETESIKQSQLVLMARVEYSWPDSFATTEVKEELGKIVKGVNKGMNSRIGNMFFQQYMLDDDREARIERLDDVGKNINDEYKAIQ